MNNIKNKALYEVELCGRKHVVETLETVVYPIKIEIEREEPCRFVLENEKIKYVFKVKNFSDVDLRNTMFKDILDRNCDYVSGSFTINGHPHRVCVHDNLLECFISELKAHETLIIAFEAKAKSFGGNNENGCDCCYNPCCNRDCGCGRGNFFYSDMIE